MCGIIFHLRKKKPLDPPQTQRLDQLIQARGPDSFRSIDRTISGLNHGQDFHLSFSASVLALRGSEPVAQPLVDEVSGCLFMWNGEAWKMQGSIVTQNDTELIFDMLLSALKNISDAGNRTLAIKDVLRGVTGPFAFLFYDAVSQQITYGRDPVGRRSLLTARTQNGFCVASVSEIAFMPFWQEVKSGGIYVLDLPQAASEVDYKERFIPWALSTEVSFKVSSEIFQAFKSRAQVWQNFFPRLNRCTYFPSNQSFPSPEIVNQFHVQLLASMQLRTTDTAPWFQFTHSHDQFAVLFSGGVDCTLLAFMLDQVLPPEHTIDLLNVAFENPRVIAAARQRASRSMEHKDEASDSIYDNCPDRKTGLSSYAELCSLCPKRTWRFVRINVPYEETLAQKACVTSLMYPHNTEMDLSISLALFFASRGRYEIRDADGVVANFTSAKILFSGLGADEIFGGYTRHAKAFDHAGFGGLLDELDLDFNRLAERNLGRDDRIISHWGREIRYPYLDDDLTRWALELPVWEKCGYGSPLSSDPIPLEPSKLLLRTLARKVGLSLASREKKRAIQFGARTAKMTVGRTKGTDSIAT